MYNEDLKQRYINEKKLSTILPDNYLDRLFKRTEPYEEMMNKDLSNFTFNEIIDMYKMFNIASMESLEVINSNLSLYTIWCLENNLVLDSQNHFYEITRENISNCINKVVLDKKIITKKQLMSWIGTLPNASDEFIVLALFEGIKGQEFCEIVNAKMSDFDIGNQIFKTCTGREVKVSTKLIEAANEANDTNIYYPFSNNRFSKYPLKNEDFIIKGLYNSTDDASDFQRGRRIYIKITRILTFLGLNDYLRPNDICESGKISYINNRAEKLGKTAIELFEDPEFIKELSAQYDFKFVKTTFLHKYADYLL